MTLDPIPIHKTLDERLTEYACIFLESGKKITASEVKSVWSDFVKLTLGKGGWQALWKIPRTTCEDLNIVFPTVVFVEVEELDFSELSALVTIVAVEDDVELPDQHEAKLIHLHPTVQQRSILSNIEIIAQCLDNLRFFYNRIWQPWDDENDRNIDWASNCLEPRMKLFRDMQDGALGPHTVSHIRKLLQEARNIHKQKLNLEKNYQSILSKKECKDESYDDKLEKEVALELMELELKWSQKTQEIEMMENPVLRDKVMEHYQKEQQVPSLLSGFKQCFIVWKGGSCQELLDLMNKARAKIPDAIQVKPCDLKSALEFVEENDSIILCPGVHEMNDEINLKRNGIIKGFPSSSDVILTSKGPCSTLIDWGGSKLELSDLSLSGQVLQASLVVRSGVISAKCCQLISGLCDGSATGLCLMPGGIAELIDCDVSGFDAGIAVHAGAKLYLVHCRITSCVIGIQVYDGAELHLKDCIIENCSEYGLVYRTNINDVLDTVGSLQMFNNSDQIVVENSKMQGNVHGDVLVSPLPSSSSLYDVDMNPDDSSNFTPSGKSDIEFENVVHSSLIID